MLHVGFTTQFDAALLALYIPADAGESVAGGHVVGEHTLAAIACLRTKTVAFSHVFSENMDDCGSLAHEALPMLQRLLLHCLTVRWRAPGSGTVAVRASLLRTLLKQMSSYGQIYVFKTS